MVERPVHPVPDWMVLVRWGGALFALFFFANVVSFENQRRLTGSGTHHYSSSEIQPAEQNTFYSFFNGNLFSLDITCVYYTPSYSLC